MIYIRCSYISQNHILNTNIIDNHNSSFLKYIYHSRFYEEYFRLSNLFYGIDRRFQKKFREYENFIYSSKELQLYTDHFEIFRSEILMVIEISIGFNSLAILEFQIYLFISNVPLQKSLSSQKQHD